MTFIESKTEINKSIVYLPIIFTIYAAIMDFNEQQSKVKTNLGERTCPPDTLSLVFLFSLFQK